MNLGIFVESALCLRKEGGRGYIIGGNKATEQYDLIGQMARNWNKPLISVTVRIGQLRYFKMIHSDEGLTLETSVLKSFTVANLPYRICG